MTSHWPVTVSGVNAGAATVNWASGPVMDSPCAIHSFHMVGVAVHEGNVVTGASEIGADGAADGARTPNQKLHGQSHPSAINARVSATATCQRASISSSGR